MKLSDYISDYFFRELKLSESSAVARKLRRIKLGIFFFLFLNASACLYAFYSIFHNPVIAIVAALIFQFIFLMIYIVLFSTIRKSDFQRIIRNKKTQVVLEQINGLEYPVKKFYTEKSENIISTKRRWSNASLRILLLIILGLGPAYFFGVMVHAPLTDEYYQRAKSSFIESNIQKHEMQLNNSRISIKKELDSLLKVREGYITSIDSLQKNPDINGYYKEDIAWLQSRLNIFEQLNADKIKTSLKKISEDSVNSIKYADDLRVYFGKSDFFYLRSQVTIKHFFATYFSAFFIFLFFLLNPFFMRYRLILNNTAELDDLLEKHYEQLIQRDYHQFVADLTKTPVAQLLEKASEDDHFSESNKNRFRGILNQLYNQGHLYDDPAVKSKHKLDTRIFVEKGHLGKYLGK